jgi:uncharacterized membrane protein YhaH (DUF805 family)
MQPVNALKAAFQNYVNFKGRTSRGGFWWYVLAYMIVAILLSFVDSAVFGSGSAEMSAGDGVAVSYNSGPLVSLWILANLIPGIAISARRLHDTDRTGWLQLLGLIPLLGWIFLIYVYVQKGTEGDNRFGADPLA